MKTTVLLDHEPVADGGFLVHALLRIEGDPPATDGRVPLNLSLVLDRSGSMHGAKLAAARKAAAMLVRRLATEDTVSVVAYDDEVDVVAAPATGEAQEDLPARIGAIRSGGMTNMSGGWLLGRDLVAKALREGGVNRVLLLTDGLANVGITDPDRLVGLTRTGAEAGISTTTIGFGKDFDEDLLRALADAGRGGSYYIEEIDQASGIFEEELEGLLSLAAQNVRVAVLPGADADFVKVLHDYPSTAEGDTLTLSVGDLYAREPRRVLMEFLLPPEATEPDGAQGGGSPADVAHIHITAHVLTAEGGVELHEIELPVTLSPVEGGQVEPEVRKEVLLVEAARAREQALEARDRGDFASGHQLLRDAADKLRAQGLDDAALQEEAEDLEGMVDSFAARSVSMADIKYMKQRAYSSHRSRRESLERYRRGKK
jgi:Ca-activated chloride channel family protein